VLPLDDTVEALDLSEQDYVPASWEQAVYRGQRWGLPLDVFPTAQYWNTDAYAAAGLDVVTDAAGFDEVMAALQDSGIEQPFRVAPGNWQLFLTLLAQFGGTLFDEAGERATFGSEAGVEALAWMRSTVDRGFSPAGVTDARAPFKNSSAALVQDLPAFIPDLQDTAPDLPWAVAPFPTIGQTPGAFANSHHLTLTQRSQEDENSAHAAATFLGWVSRNSASWADGGNIPAFAEARADPSFADARQNPLATDEVLESLAFLPLVPNSRDIAANSYQRAVSEVVISAADPADAARYAQNTAQAQLDGLRELYGL
jgi:multiple sugar transport system substrate-binding protein